MADNGRTTTVWEETNWGTVTVVVVVILCVTAYELYDRHLESQGDKAKIELLQEKLKAHEGENDGR